MRRATSATPRRSTSAPNQLAAGRVVQYTPAHQLPLAEVKDRVRQQLAGQRRRRRWRRKLGAERLAAARAAPQRRRSPATTLIVSRAQPRDLPRAAARRGAEGAGGDAAGVRRRRLGDQGYAVCARSSRSAGRDPVVADPAKAKAQYAQVWADAEAQAYYAALKTALQGEDQRASRATRRRGERGAEPSRDLAAARSLAIIRRFGGGCSSVGRVQDCDSCCRGFESHQPPHTSRQISTCAPICVRAVGPQPPASSARRWP